MKLNTPNKLTIARMIIAPVFLAVLLWDSLPHKFLWAMFIFIAASVTDAIDGKNGKKKQSGNKFRKTA